MTGTKYTTGLKKNLLLILLLLMPVFVVNNASANEQAVVEAILKGNPEEAFAQSEKWQKEEPANPIPDCLVKKFNISLGYSDTPVLDDHACIVWMEKMRDKHPGNPHFLMMTVGFDCGDLDCKEREFKKILAMKGRDMGFNFNVGSCEYWIEDYIGPRLQNDWEQNPKSLPAALRLVRNKTCCNDDLCSSESGLSGAERILRSASKLTPKTPAIKELWGRIYELRQIHKRKSLKNSSTAAPHSPAKP